MRLLPVVCICALLALCRPDLSGAVYREVDGLVAMEAEMGGPNTGWTVVSGNSGSALIDDGPRTRTASVLYEIDFATAGDWFCWAYHRSPNGDANDCYSTLEYGGGSHRLRVEGYESRGSAYRPDGMSSKSTGMTWECMGKLPESAADARGKRVYFTVPAPGRYVMRMRSRALLPGYVVDKIVLKHRSRADATSAPAGTGPAETLLAADVTADDGDASGGNVLGVSGTTLTFNGSPITLRGLRLSNALVSDAEVDEVIANLPVYKSYGINAFSVFIMGSRFGDIKGFRPDATLDPVYAARLGRLLEAGDQAGMVTVVGCLYWSTSRAKEDLGGWTQAQADLAVANASAFVRASGRRNVIIDPDNEGMARAAKGWSIGDMIAAGKRAAPGLLFGYNATGTASANCDLTLHFGQKLSTKPYVETEGVPSNAPGGYWGSYSKKDGVYNYINIGVYSADMRSNQIAATTSTIGSRAGYFMASTWLQCVAPAGPNHGPGGAGTSADPGIRWWLEAVRSTYGAWVPPGPGSVQTPTVHRLALYDATTSTRIADLTPGLQMDRSVHPRIAVVAETGDATGCVRFGLDGVTNFRTENTPPYALHGDTGGVLEAWSPGLGSHTVTATPSSADGLSGTVGATVSVTFAVVDGASQTQPIRVNFQPAAAPSVSTHAVDAGLAFGSRASGRSYGWSRDVSTAARDRNVLADQLRDTFVHSMLGSPAVWEIAVPNGTYQVHLTAGDPSYHDSVYVFTLEGKTALTGTPTSAGRFVTASATVTVDDGRLTLGNGSGAVNNKICAIEVEPVPLGVN